MPPVPCATSQSAPVMVAAAAEDSSVRTQWPKAGLFPPGCIADQRPSRANATQKSGELTPPGQSSADGEGSQWINAQTSCLSQMGILGGILPSLEAPVESHLWPTAAISTWHPYVACPLPPDSLSSPPCTCFSIKPLAPKSLSQALHQVGVVPN